MILNLWLEEVVGLLLSARAKLDMVTQEKQSALHFAARAGAPGAIVDEVLKVTSKDGKGKGKGGQSSLKVDVMNSVEGWELQNRWSFIFLFLRPRTCGAALLCIGLWWMAIGANLEVGCLCLRMSQLNIPTVCSWQVNGCEASGRRRCMDIPPCQHLLHDSDYLWCGILILNHFFFGKSSIFEGKLAPVVLLPTEIRSGGHQKLSSSAVGFFQVLIGPYPTTWVKPPWLWPSDGPSVELKIDLQTWEPQQLGSANLAGGFRYRKFQKWEKKGEKKQSRQNKKMPIWKYFFLKGKVWSKISGLKQMIFKSFFFNGQWSASNDADQWPQTSFQREPFSRQLSVQRSLVTLLLCWADLLALRSNDREKCHFQRRFFTPTHLTLSGDCSSKHVNLRKPYQKF